MVSDFFYSPSNYNDQGQILKFSNSIQYEKLLLLTKISWCASYQTGKDAQDLLQYQNKSCCFFALFVYPFKVCNYLCI